jgi:hypothetical protein
MLLCRPDGGAGPGGAVTVLVPGLKPFIIMAFSIAAARILPHYFDAAENGRTILYKLACFSVALGGLYMVLVT